tara:strand:- start:6114 stop:6527 length:414 start_codon:yes stop_codon:yes gene_type:complete
MTVPTKTISIGGVTGNTVTINEYLTRGDRRKVDRHVRHRALSDMGELNESGIDIEKLRSDAANTAPGETVNVQNDDEDDMLLQLTVRGWNLGHENVNDPTIEQIENLPSKIVDRFLKVIHAQYDVNEESLENLDKTP